ncbi:hypothetical protein SAY86_005959 [Trapa natans]|uniref:Histone-binding protein RBBP4-like N-terminal domain-containing protein n=1 Tax=Trapa natans TaxID=22666 RepID=A0AAN7LCB3_TRANT|nr:hypothetical protein SAY86_005959 [Trapa natans]
MEAELQQPLLPKKRGRKPKPTLKEEEEQSKSAKESSGRRSHSDAADEKYIQWKSLVPVLYDWLTNHNLVWPSLSCRWGPQLEQSTYKNRQRLYISEQTDGSVPNTLIIATCDVVKHRVTAAEHISQYNEEAWSPFMKKYKTIIHPGEVNRIQELHLSPKIVATHTDSPDVLIWDVESQPNRHAVYGATPSCPDLVLTGHQDNAEFALAMSPAEPFVLSGVGPSIGPRGIYVGHEDTVEDVAFCPSSAEEFCSVGDDSCLILWDARVGTSPAIKVVKAHNADLHCVDWNPHDSNLILTGSTDNSIHMFDRRNLTSNGVGSPVYKFEGHKAAVLCVQWSPDESSVFGSSAEDGLLNIWDYEKVGKKMEHETKSSAPEGLFFQHAGHRDKVVDFHWDAYDPWTMVSVSDDCDTTGGGGTLQIWRMSDLIYRPEDDVLAELEKFKAHVLECSKA